MEILKDLQNIIFGEYTKLIVLFVLFILLDLITGICASIKEGEKISSKKARNGFYSKIGSIICLIFGFIADEFFKTIVVFEWMNLKYENYYIGTMVSAYLCVIEAISILENLNRINNNIVPKFLKKFFNDTKNKIEK